MSVLLKVVFMSAPSQIVTIPVHIGIIALMISTSIKARCGAGAAQTYMHMQTCSAPHICLLEQWRARHHHDFIHLGSCSIPRQIGKPVDTHSEKLNCALNDAIIRSTCSKSNDSIIGIAMRMHTQSSQSDAA